MRHGLIGVIAMAAMGWGWTPPEIKNEEAIGRVSQTIQFTTQYKTVAAPGQALFALKVYRGYASTTNAKSLLIRGNFFSDLLKYAGVTPPKGVAGCYESSGGVCTRLASSRKSC